MGSVRTEPPHRVDLVRTVRPLVRGRGDPTTRVEVLLEAARIGAPRLGARHEVRRGGAGR